MGVLSKEAYEGKQRYAERKQAEIKANCDSLTPEQHDALADICRIRHEIHCNMESVFNSESAFADRFNTYIDHEINDILKAASLPAIVWSHSIEEIEDDSCYYAGITDFDCVEDAQEACLSIVADLHNAIEKYLANIDKQHGTEYCPTGATRIY